MTPAERLHAAADRIEGLAKEATEGPWEAGVNDHSAVLPNDYAIWMPDMGCDGALVEKEADAAWIATVSPVIAGPLVEWLRKNARVVNLIDSAALELADAILGGSTT